MSVSEDPLRRLARERGAILGELGVRPGDHRWAKAEAETLASLLTPSLAPRMAQPLLRFLRKLRRRLR